MKKVLPLLTVVLLTLNAPAQLYFPPNGTGGWDTVSPSSLGWCQPKIDSLYDFLDSNNTKAFILLKNGRIVLEKYYGEQSAASYWYWASAGKTLTAFMTGIAQEENYLKITDTTSRYLGQGWTSCSTAEEQKITIRHQLTMTSGLDDEVADPYCTLPSCLVYKANAGERWAYHNGPYTLLDSVITIATGSDLNLYVSQKLKIPTGMDGLFLRQGYNNVFFSTARSMARFGLLILSRGNWNGMQIMTDTVFFNEMVNTSQELNKSYGYLWWLNGKTSFMVPQSQIVFPGSFSPHAPDDMIAALGKNGQFINVVPSDSLVWIRMGDAPGDSLVPFLLNDRIWQFLNALSCNTSSGGEKTKEIPGVLYPDPSDGMIAVKGLETTGKFSYTLYSAAGKVLQHGRYVGPVDLSELPGGIYYLVLSDGLNRSGGMIIKK